MIKLLIGTLAIIPLFASTFSCSAKDLSKELRTAQKALAAGKYEKSYQEYQHFAQKDNALAQFSIALFHEHGWGREKNKALACDWYGKAAEQSIPAANHFYGECLENGIGRPSDPEKAIQWYQRAVDQGHFISLCSIADLHMNGRGIKRNPSKAIALCQQAAEKDIPAAQLQTGLYYLYGDQSIINEEKAAFWLHHAAKKDLPEAQYYLGILLRDGKEIKQDVIRARTWLEHAASKGEKRAYFPCGKLYFEGASDQQINTLSENDLAKAYLWLTAAEKAAINSDEREQVAEMLSKIREIMPTTWLPDLNSKVQEHFHKFPI